MFYMKVKKILNFNNLGAIIIFLLLNSCQALDQKHCHRYGIGNIHISCKEVIVPKSFFFMRHGQTAANKKGVFYLDGQGEYGLTIEGKAQVLKAVEQLKKQKISVIISAPSLRTRETAEIISSYLNIPVIINNDLREVHIKAIDGRNINDPKAREIIKSWEQGNKFEGEESMAEFQQRIVKVMHKILSSYNNVLIIGHGKFYSTLLKILEIKVVERLENAIPYYLAAPKKGFPCWDAHKL